MNNATAKPSHTVKEDRNMNELVTIHGTWSEEANAWVSEVIELTGNAWLEVTLPGQGIVIIKKSESREGPWPKALISPWSGPDFRIRLYGSTTGRFIRIETTEEPTEIQYVNV